MRLHVELFYSPYCPRCRKARQQVRALAAAWSAKVQFRELDVVQELDRAVSLGVLRTPALAIEGEVIAGPVPSPRSLETLFRKRLKEQESK